MRCAILADEVDRHKAQLFEAAARAAIREAMADYGLSNRQLAVAIGSTHPTVANLLTGRSAMTLEKLSLIAQAMSLDPRYLLNRSV